MNVTYEVGAAPNIDALCDLREAVGWDRAEGDYPEAFDAYATCVAALGPDRELIGWCAAVSDGVRHGFLLDVIVDPQWRRRGIGRRLVAHTVDALRRLGIAIVHVDFAPEHRTFYARCGFRASEAGILYVAGSSGGDVPDNPPLQQSGDTPASATSSGRAGPGSAGC